MNDCEQMINVLEEKVNVLSIAIDTSNTTSFEEARKEVHSKENVLRFVQLINSVIEISEGDTPENESKLFEEKIKRDRLAIRIQNILNSTNALMQKFSTDAKLFDYEIDSVTTKDSNGSIVSIDSRLYPARKGVRITSYKGKGENIVVVPKSIDGYPVVSIGTEAFQESDMREIVLPSTVLAIFSRAFWGCANLEHIVLPNNIRHLGEYCFSNSGIRSIRFPNSISDVSTGCCFGCSQLTDVLLGDNVFTICSGAFMNCTEIKNIILPKTTTKIGSSAFSGTSLTQLIVPESVREIAKDCFSHPYLKGTTSVTCVILGKNTIIRASKKDRLQGITMFYCHPGSEIENTARTNKIPVKPISEFRMEDYQ